MAIPWSVLECFEDINDAVAIWNELFIDVANRHAPLKKIRMKSASKPWISKDLREQMAERDYAKRIAKKSGAQEQWNNYRRLKNLTKRKLKSAENIIAGLPRAKRAWSRAPYSWNMVNLFSFGCHVTDRAYVRTYVRTRLQIVRVG